MNVVPLGNSNSLQNKHLRVFSLRVRKLRHYASIKFSWYREIWGLVGMVLISGTFKLQCMGRPQLLTKSLTQLSVVRMYCITSIIAMRKYQYVSTKINVPNIITGLKSCPIFYLEIRTTLILKKQQRENLQSRYLVLDNKFLDLTLQV